jgi:hypothetical protein
MVLCENDGYYLAEHVQTADGGSRLMWHMKRPYIIEYGGYTYSVTLDMTSISRVDDATLAFTPLSPGASPFSREQILQHVNLQLNREIRGALERFALSRNLGQYQIFYLPIAEGGVSRVERPSLITVLQDVRHPHGQRLSLSTVSGFKVTDRRVVTAWTDAHGNKWYAYAFAGAGAGEVFATIDEAARAGYSPRLGG